MSDTLKSVIESVLKDVHIETGRKDQWENVVNDLVSAIEKAQREQMGEDMKLEDTSKYKEMMQTRLIRRCVIGGFLAGCTFIILLQQYG